MLTFALQILIMAFRFLAVRFCSLHFTLLEELYWAVNGKKERRNGGGG
jgi:hypothetical protein